jgi:hypothetical protein
VPVIKVVPPVVVLTELVVVAPVDVVVGVIVAPVADPAVDVVVDGVVDVIVVMETAVLISGRSR